MKALILDSAWRPVSFVKESRAAVMVITGKAEVVTDWEDRQLCSPRMTINSPAVIRLPSYVHRQYGTPRFRRLALYSRDGWQCQYCGSRLPPSSLTIDHVVPRARGGKTSWSNCVAACRGCNRKKGCLLPREAGMSLRKQPSVPSGLHFWDFRNKSECDTWHPTWSQFLEGKNV